MNHISAFYRTPLRDTVVYTGVPQQAEPEFDPWGGAFRSQLPFVPDSQHCQPSPVFLKGAFMVRGKFRLSEVTGYAGGTSQKFVFSAVSPADGEIEENAKYHKYTPSGKLEMTVDNPPAQEQLKLGDYFYLDFTPVQ